MRWNVETRAEVAAYVIVGFLAVLAMAFGLKELFGW